MPDKHKEVIYFAGGCFWCTEAIFQNLRGVISVVPGYVGGLVENPSYDDVAEGAPGYAETVEVVYDSREIDFKDFLTVFFATHDPTSVNRQGADVGAQYRSAVFYTTTEQKEAVEEYITEINRSSDAGKRVVTEVLPLEKFYKAEEDHRNYYNKNSQNSYCRLVINPKLKKVEERFAELLKR